MRSEEAMGMLAALAAPKGLLCSPSRAPWAYMPNPFSAGSRIMRPADRRSTEGAAGTHICPRKSLVSPPKAPISVQIN